MQRILAIGVTIVSITLLITMSTFYGKKYIILNTTDSLPHGFYKIVKKEKYCLNDLVVFPIPASVKRTVVGRHWLPENGLLIKNIVALPGDSFSTLEGKYVVKDEFIGSILKIDSEGRSMPVFEKNDTLNSGILVARRGVKTSFDSRYFGAIPIDNILGVAVPFFLFE